jgi:hypothetical protein
MTDTPAALRFSVDDSHAREPKPGERYYRIELADGREALILATTVTVRDGALIANTDGEITLVLQAGSWASAYMCEAVMAYDPWSILQLKDRNQ